MDLNALIITTVLKGFMTGALLHVLTWIVTRGLVWLGNAFSGDSLL